MIILVSRYRRAILVCFFLACVAAYHPVVLAEAKMSKIAKRELAAQRTADEMLKKHPELAPYFDNAVGYAVFPRVYKVASMWSGAWGKGAVIESGKFVGTTWLGGGGLGPQIGVQTYRQIIFFKTQEALDTYKSTRFEFTGRASVAVIALGASIDPAYLPDVAIFTDIGVGLMAEASANIVWYDYKPLAAAPPPE